MKAVAAIAAWIRQRTAAAASLGAPSDGPDSGAMNAWDALTGQAEEQLNAWSTMQDATGRAAALHRAADCRDLQARTAGKAFNGAIGPASIPSIVRDVTLSAVLLRLVALTENADLVKPGAGGQPALDPEALEIQLLEVGWLDYSDALEIRLVEAVEPHLYEVAALRWDVQAGPRSRRYAAALTELAEAVAELSRKSKLAERWALQAASGWSGALSRHATEQADRP